ncbi:GAF and ANTAR domain-containing protein [Streptomyces collinus]
MSREQQLAEAVVGLADPFADDVDPVVLGDRLARACVDITGADAVGVMVASARGDLRTLAVTDERAAFMELFQLQTDEGPCLDCYREGRRVDARDMSACADRWPQVAPFALRSGFGSVHAVPLRVHRQTVGAVNMLIRKPGGLPPLDLELAQTLADVTAVALVTWSSDRVRPADVSGRVQVALAAKATVDMASGMIAEAGGLSLPEARAALRAHVGGHRGRLLDTAQALVRRTLSPRDVLTADADAPPARD